MELIWKNESKKCISMKGDLKCHVHVIIAESQLLLVV